MCHRPAKIRFCCVQYLCQFPGIDPAEMAASLQHDGFTILFDDSSISAKANAVNRAAVNKAAREGRTMKRNRLKKCSHNLLLIGIDPPLENGGNRP